MPSRSTAALRVGEGPQVVEREDRGVRDLEQAVLELLDGRLQLPGHLLVGGGALELRLELGVRLLDVAGAGSHGAGHPVQRPKLVDDRPLDSRDREGLELDLAVEVEALDRTDQADQAVGDQVALLDVGWEPRRHPAGDELDQRRVRDDEMLARSLVPVLLVPSPELP